MISLQAALRVQLGLWSHICLRLVWHDCVFFSRVFAAWANSWKARVLKLFIYLATSIVAHGICIAQA